MVGEKTVGFSVKRLKQTADKGFKATGRMIAFEQA